MAKDQPPVLYLVINNLKLDGAILLVEAMLVRKKQPGEQEEEWGTKVSVPIQLPEDEKLTELMRDLKIRLVEVFEERMNLGIDVDASKPG